MKFVSVLIALILPWLCQAKTTDADKNGLAEKARHRQYLGGRDEEELKPQSSLPQPLRSADGGAPVVAPARNEPPPD